MSISFRKYELYCKPSKVGEGAYNDYRKAKTPDDVYEVCKVLKMHLFSREKVYALYLDSAGNLIGVVEIGSGGVNSAQVDQKVIFGPALSFGKCVAVILAHNHPSGYLEPSSDDKRLTRQTEEAGKLLGVTLIDHLIVGENGYYSFKENGLLD